MRPTAWPATPSRAFGRLTGPSVVRCLFGSKSGLTSFWPEEIVEKPFIPPVVLTGFLLRNQPVAPRPSSLLAKSISFTPSLTLSHEQNLFSFEFAALSFVDPERNQYRYMLEGLDHSWNRVDPKHRLATFTSLPTGDYTLRVQGSNNRGVWNEQGVALHLQTSLPGGQHGGFELSARLFLCSCCGQPGGSVSGNFSRNSTCAWRGGSKNGRASRVIFTTHSCRVFRG